MLMNALMPHLATSEMAPITIPVFKEIIVHIIAREKFISHCIHLGNDDHDEGDAPWPLTPLPLPASHPGPVYLCTRHRLVENGSPYLPKLIKKP